MLPKSESTNKMHMLHLIFKHKSATPFFHKILMVAATLIFTLVLLLLALKIWGKEYYATSVDLAHHYGLIQTIALVKGVNLNHPLYSYLGGMQLYPPVTHVLAVILGGLMGSYLRGMFFVSLIALFGIYLFIGWMIKFKELIPSLISSFTFLVLLCCFHRTNIFVGGEIIENFFFAQLVGFFIFLAMVFFIGILSAHFIIKGTISLFITFVLGWVYPISAIEFAAASLIFPLLSLHQQKTFKNVSWKFATCWIIFTILQGAAIILHPSFTFMKNVSTNEGGMAVFLPPDLSIILLTSSLAILVCVLLRTMTRSFSGLSNLSILIVSAGGICAASIAQLLLFYLIHMGSRYGTEKHIFAVSTLIAAIVSVLVACPFRKMKIATPSLANMLLPSVTAMIALAIILPKQGAPIKPLDKYQQAIANLTDRRFIIQDHTVSANSHFSAVENFIVSTGDLHFDIATALGFNINPVYLGDAYPKLLADHQIQFELTSQDSNPPQNCIRQYLPDNIVIVDYRCIENKG